jgi:4-carboxymuconolactone decarboxylase
MDERERHERGMAVRRQVLGNEHVDRAVGQTSALTSEFQELLTRYVWGEIWTRPGLDHRTRRVLVIGTLLALGRWEELRMHVGAALEHGGFSADDVKEILLQQAMYCGIPAANHAFQILRDVLEPHGA